MTERFQEGDRVNFTARGRMLTGTITRLRMKRRKGRARQLAKLVTGDADSLDRPVAEIVPDGGGAVWTVPMSSISKRLAAAAPAQQQAAYATVHGIKRAGRDRRDKVSDANMKSLRASGLWDLHCGPRSGEGTAIEIKFSDIGWAPAEFIGLVPGSLNVRYLRHGRTRTTAAQNARIPEPAGGDKRK
jgi:hypothetical protein